MGDQICPAGCVGRAQKHQLETPRSQFAVAGNSRTKARRVEFSGLAICT
jgi:hypothetical protein